MNVYERCPVMMNDFFLLRLVDEGDCDALLKVYSDEKAVPLFNSDNCHGDHFYYTTKERMLQAIRFWRWSYEQRYFVRWSVVDCCTGAAVGTIELFRRSSQDSYDGCGILRLDLHSDYETHTSISRILALLLPHAFGLFGVNFLATKASCLAAERRAALAEAGFEKCTEPLVGENGSRYADYFVLYERK